MPKIQTFTGLGNLKDPQEFIRHGSKAIAATADVVNGKLEFDKNLDTQTVTVTFPAANTDVKVDHQLNRIVKGYIVAKKSADCSVFDGQGTSTSNAVYLRSTQAATVTVILS